MLISEAIALLERRLGEEGDTEVVANLADGEDPWSKIVLDRDYYICAIVQYPVTLGVLTVDTCSYKSFEGVFYAFQDEEDPSVIRLQSIEGEIDSKMVVHFYEIYDHEELMQFAE